MADEQHAVQQGTQPALSPMLLAISRPIPGANPCGKDISYEEDFLSVKAEIDKLGIVGGHIDQERATELRQMMDATRGTFKKTDRTEAEKQLDQHGSVVKHTGGPDYRLIEQTAVRILSERSKDIRIASYLCYALWQLNTFAGLAEGISAMEILVRDFWDGLYPSKNRPGARKGAVDFLTSKLDESMEYAQARESDREPLERAKAALAGLQKLFTEKLPDNPPSLLGLGQAVDKCLNKIPRQAEAKPSAPAPGTQPQSARPGEQHAPSAIPSGDIRTSQDAVAVVKQAVKFFRDQNPRSALPYRLIRTLRWDPVLALPPNENGKTKFEAPPAQRRAYLGGLKESLSWNALLEECESSFSQPGFHLWLDLQRLAVTALEALGSDYQSVRMAVLTELAFLVARVPKLESLSFSDGTRFADAATGAWIEETVRPVLGATSTGNAAMTQPGSDGEPEALAAEAGKIFESGDLAGAIALLMSVRADASRKSMFRRKLVMAALCLRGNQPAIARSLLEDLEQDIERFSIPEWEPSLALEAWSMLHRCYELLATGPVTPARQAIQQRREQVFERICRLDVRFALASAGVKPPAKRPAAAEQSESRTGNGSGQVHESNTHPPS